MRQGRENIARVARSKEEARTSYNRLSRWYDVLAGRWEIKFQRQGLEMLRITEGEVVLEIGFGTGGSLVALGRSAGASGRVIGLDISEGMCHLALKKIQKSGLRRRIQLILGDGVALPFKISSFDAIFLCFTLELFDKPEIPVVLSECARVLRSGQRLCLVAVSKLGKSGMMTRLYEWAHRTFPRPIDCRPIFAHKALSEAGFRVHEATTIKLFGLPVEIVLSKK
jgi:demethylmenaquinone methyltransferase/2-methoxy-6-polyprenyl-1,4-benzoquinol methylase